MEALAAGASPGPPMRRMPHDQRAKLPLGDRFAWSVFRRLQTQNTQNWFLAWVQTFLRQAHHLVGNLNSTALPPLVRNLGENMLWSHVLTPCPGDRMSPSLISVAPVHP